MSKSRSDRSPKIPPSKTGSRGNALRHGLTATRVLPLELRERMDHYQQALRTELMPQSILENILVAELGRHAAGMDLAQTGETAAIELAGQVGRAANATISDSLPTNIAIVRAITSDAAERSTRYRRAHERAFYSALRALGEIRSCPEATPQIALPRFDDEHACEEHLARVQSQRACRCGCSDRRWLAVRKRFQCRRCGRQAGLREGTAFGKSRLPLKVWFGATILLSIHPQMLLRDLAMELNVRRLETLRGVRRRILSAASSRDATLLLAELPELVHATRRHCASRAFGKARLQNELTRGLPSEAKAEHRPNAAQLDS
jgi:hypothetical protein